MMMINAHAALATPWWSRRRKLSMKTHTTVKIHSTKIEKMNRLQKTPNIG